MYVKAQRYNPEQYDEVNSWYHKRNLPTMPIELLPEVGFIVPGIAAAFLYQTDSGVAFLEGCISNPEAKKEERSEALDLLMECMIKISKTLNYKLLIASSMRTAILRNCENHGFANIGNFTMYAKELI